MKQFFIGLSVIVFASCSNSTRNQPNEEQTISHSSEFNQSDLTTKLESNNLWLSENYEPYLDFSQSEESVWIVYSGQCMYKYPIVKKNNLIEVKYDTIMDCLVDIGFRKNFRVKSPEIGETFIELTQNEDTLFADYLFLAWVDSLNAEHQTQPLFVEKFVKTNMNQPLNSDYTYCDSIHFLKEKWEESNSNYYINRIVPELEKASGINSSCNKGTVGYLYSDKDLSSDLRKWSEYFGCI